MHYQPKVDSRTGEAVGVECLVRWQHPSRGLIPPSHFIPLAESTGLIKPLTLWVIRQALQDSRSWQAEGLAIPVAVNLSAPLLHDAELPHAIGRELPEADGPEGRLELEITESAVMHDPGGAMKTISLLQSLGIAFALDDFHHTLTRAREVQRACRPATVRFVLLGQAFRFLRCCSFS